MTRIVRWDCRLTKELPARTRTGYSIVHPMKPSSFPLLRLGSILLLITCGNAVGEDKPAIALSPELAINAPEVPDEKNAIILFEQRLEKLDVTTSKSLSEAVKQLRGGTPVNDPALFKKVEERHLVAREVLKAPARTPRRTTYTTLPLYLQILNGADALAYKSSLEGNRAATLEYRRDMLEWSRLIRGSHPEFIVYVMGLVGWRNAFNGMLHDWERHPDQKAGLAEIEALLREFPCPWSELVPVFQREAQFWCDSGGTKGFLEKLPRNQSTALFLREPFDKLTVGDLLDLPYDEASETRRLESQILATIAEVRKESPLIGWPGFGSEKPAGKDLETYRKRPNGLGDLMNDYPTESNKRMLSLIVFHQPAMETCLAWLKAEGEGKEFTGDSPGVKPDPMTGKLLKIEPENRRIRSVGPNMEFEKMEGDERTPGIFMAEDDRVLKVPRWRRDK